MNLISKEQVFNSIFTRNDSIQQYEQFARLKKILKLYLCSYSYCREKSGFVNPVHALRLTHVINEHLNTTLYENLEGIVDPDDNISLLRILLGWLTNLGDLYNLGNGYYLPAPARVIEMVPGKYGVLVGAHENMRSINKELTTDFISMLSIADLNSINPEELPIVKRNVWNQIPALDGWLFELLQNGTVGSPDDIEELYNPTISGMHNKRWIEFSHETEMNEIRLVRGPKRGGRRRYWLLEKLKMGMYVELQQSQVRRAFYAIDKLNNVHNRIAFIYSSNRPGDIVIKMYNILPEEEIKYLQALGFPLVLNKKIKLVREWLVSEVFSDLLEELFLNLGIKVTKNRG